MKKFIWKVLGSDPQIKISNIIIAIVIIIVYKLHVILRILYYVTVIKINLVYLFIVYVQIGFVMYNKRIHFTTKEYFDLIYSLDNKIICITRVQ